jgi:lysophospholipase L1-like esterase
VVTAPLQVWPLGDSITQGAIGPSKGIPGGYRSFLDVELQAAGVEHQFIGSLRTNSTALLDARAQAAHEGHPAFYAADVSAGINGPVSAHNYKGGFWLRPLHPDLVLLHIGTNDVIHRVDPGVRYPTRDGKLDPDNAAQRARFVAHLTARVQGIVDQVHRLRPHASFIVATVTPVGTDACDEVTPDYARAIRGLVKREQHEGVSIWLADVWSAYTRVDDRGCQILPGLISADRVHPTSAGYGVMAQVFAEAMLRLSA